MAQVTITVRNEHPRLVFRIDGTAGARTFQGVRDLYALDHGNPISFYNQVQTWMTGAYTTPIDQAARFVITDDLSKAQSALDQMYGGTLTYGGTEGAEAGLQWALAYDWIYNAWQGHTPPANLAPKLANIEGKIATWVSAALNDLDTDGPSLWHGRAALGAFAWTAALALPTDNSTYDLLRSRAWYDWQQALKASHAAGAWPEGATYWANNRAISFPLAYAAYTTAVSAAPALEVADPLADLRAFGLWQAYSERGDGSMDRYGDVSSAVQISNGTLGRSIDEYAMITQDPALAAFAQDARQYRTPFYYSPYGWMYPVAYDHTQAKPPGYTQSDPGAVLATALPHAMVFGKDAEGFAVMRQGWSAGDTQISFKAGDYLAHHGHYDQGTFTIFKYSPLVINSGNYGDYTGDERLNYYIRTISTNGIVVQRPNETWNNRGVPPPSGWANDGGQRLVQPTGSTVSNYENWLANKTAGRNYESGNITAFSNLDGNYAYVGSDITRAYNSTLFDSQGQGGKVSKVTRQMVYLEDIDALVVFDRVNSTNANYKKKWVLHTPNKMIGGTPEVVRLGAATDGLMEVDGSTIPNNTLTMTNGGGKLFLQTLLPASYKVNKVGGPNYRYYVEDDGDDTTYDGTNYSAGANSNPWFDNGDWRIEISPQAASLNDTFLNVLSPRSSAAGSVPLATVLLNNALATIMELGPRVVGFGTVGVMNQDILYTVPDGGSHSHLIVDLVANQIYRITWPDGAQYARADDQGVLLFSETSAGSHLLTIAASAGLPGDANSDGAVTFADYQILETHFGTTTGAAWGDGDFNGDGKVSFIDYQILESNFGESIPEPAALVLLVLGSLALARRKRA